MFTGQGTILQRKQSHIDQSEGTPGKTSLDYAIQEALTQHSFTGVDTAADIAACQPVKTYLQGYLDGITPHAVQTQIGTFFFSLDTISETQMFLELSALNIKPQPGFVTLNSYTP